MALASAPGADRGFWVYAADRDTRGAAAAVAPAGGAAPGGLACRRGGVWCDRAYGDPLRRARPRWPDRRPDAGRGHGSTLAALRPHRPGRWVCLHAPGAD